MLYTIINCWNKHVILLKNFLRYFLWEKMQTTVSLTTFKCLFDTLSMIANAILSYAFREWRTVSAPKWAPIFNNEFQPTFPLPCYLFLIPLASHLHSVALPVSTVPKKGWRAVKLLWLPSFKLWRVVGKRKQFQNFPHTSSNPVQGFLHTISQIVCSLCLCHTPPPPSSQENEHDDWMYMSKNEVNQITKMQGRKERK